LLEHSLIDFKFVNNPLDVGVNVNVNFDHIIQLIDESVMIIESNVLNMEVPLISSSGKGDPIVSLKWSDNIPTNLKNKVLFEVEMKQLPIQFKDFNKLNDFNEIEFKGEEELIYEKENDMKWKKICETKENTIKLKENECRWNECYTFRIRAFFIDTKSFSQYSSARFGSTVIDLESTILTKEEKCVLISYLPKGFGTKLKLLFRASRDGFGASNFHNKCNNQGPTVTIVHSEKNHVFGGSTAQSWTSNSQWKKDSEAFLYLLRSSNASQKSQKWTIKAGQEEYAIYNHSVYGPTFGHGHNLRLWDNCNSNKDSYSNPSVSYNGPTSHDVLAGERNFSVKDYEVFQVQ